MKTIPTFKKGLAQISAFSRRGDYAGALARVGELLKNWPDNPHLLLLHAELIQLSDEPARPLDQARAALQRSAALDPEAPQAHLELGQFKFAVDDAAREAVKDFDRAIALCQRLLREALTARLKRSRNWASARKGWGAWPRLTGKKRKPAMATATPRKS